MHAVIEFNSTCTLRCVFCPIAYDAVSRYGTVMSDEVFNKIVEQIRPCVTYIYIGGYGEFLLHSHFAQYVRTLRSFARLSLATNLTVLTEENLEVLGLIDDLSISISAEDAETYRKVHGRDYFEKVQSNLRRLKRPYITTRVATSISHGTKPLALPLRKEMEYLWTPEYSRFDWVDGKLQLKQGIADCREMWRTIYFLANGDVTFCCYDHDGTAKLGNIQNQTLDEIWRGEAYQSLRKNHLAGVYHPVCLNQCSRM